MTTEAKPSDEEGVLLTQMLDRLPFGPLFFVGHLAAFVRDRCPAPGESLPRVELKLHDGEAVELCHIIGLAPRWVALATRDPTARGGMQTVILPYEAIVRVTIRALPGGHRHLGFDQSTPPVFVEDRASAETILAAAARPPET